MPDPIQAIAARPARNGASRATSLPAGSTRADFDARLASFPVNLHDTAIDAEGFMPVLDAPTGFMLIARYVFVRLAAAFPELRYTPDASAQGTGATPHYRFFDMLAEPGNGRHLPEDFAFCRRWQSIGGVVLADARSRLQHHGQHTFVGDLPRALALRQGVKVGAGAR